MPSVVSLAQSFGSLAHWHPHLQVVVTDGGFRRDGSFVTQTAHDAAVLAEAWRHAVLALFVRENWTPVIGSRHRLTETCEAFRRLAEGHARGKIVVTMDRHDAQRYTAQ